MHAVQCVALGNAATIISLLLGDNAFIIITLHTLGQFKFGRYLLLHVLKYVNRSTDGKKKVGSGDISFLSIWIESVERVSIPSKTACSYDLRSSRQSTLTLLYRLGKRRIASLKRTVSKSIFSILTAEKRLCLHREPRFVLYQAA